MPAHAKGKTRRIGPGDGADSFVPAGRELLSVTSIVKSRSQYQMVPMMTLEYDACR